MSGKFRLFVMRYRTAYGTGRNDTAFYRTSRRRNCFGIFVFRRSLFCIRASLAQTHFVATREVFFVEVSESGRGDGRDRKPASGANAFGIRAFRTGGFEFLRHERMFRRRHVISVFYGAAGAFEDGITFFRARRSDD